MFEVGKEYEFCNLMVGEDGLCEVKSRWTVTAVDGHLLHLHVPASEGLTINIKLADADEELGEKFVGGPTPERNMVLNTASAFFHSASPVTDEE